MPIDYSKIKTEKQIASLSDKELLELNRVLEQTKGQTDLYYLTTKILGYGDLGKFHKVLCKVVESINPVVMFLSKQSDYKTMDEAREAVRANIRSIAIDPEYAEFFKLDEDSLTRLFLLFRGSFKTTIISIAHTIQLMLIWPEIRILISSHKKEGGSQEILGAIKRHFIGNDRFRKVYVEWVPKPNNLGVVEWGTTEKVTLPNRAKFAVFPEATIEIAGATTDVTGRHYDYIKADDLVTRDSVTNETMLEKTDEYNSLLKFLFNQPEYGIIDYSGTCYHFADIYAGLREQDKITKVIIPVTTPNGKPTFPERFTESGVENLRTDPAMSSYVWSCQYMLNPIPEADQTFRPEWWNKPGFYYDDEIGLPHNMKVAIFVDPANSQKKKSDYTSLFVLGLDEKGHYWVLDMIRDKLDVEGRANLAIKFAIKHGIHKINYESVGFQNTDAYIIKKLSAELGHYIEVNELKGTIASKEDRIRALQPIFERGMIHLPKKYDYYSQYHKRSINMVDVFNKEAWLFPKNEHDDMIDCLSQLCRVTMYVPTKKVAPQSTDMFDRARQMAIDAKKPKNVFHGFGNKNMNKHRGIPFKKSLW